MRILTLTSGTGGGHNMRARSFAAWAEVPEAADLKLEVRTYLALESTHRVYGFGVALYNWIQRSWPRLHHLYFNFLELMSLHRRARYMVGKDSFRRELLDYRPDVVLSVHAHLNHGYFDIARETLPGVRCVTYCGELNGGYGFSRHWVNPAADLFIGAVEECCAAARRLGMPEARVALGGFMLTPEFFRTPVVGERKRYVFGDMRLDPGRFLLVLSTGAVGANNHLSILDALDQAGLDIQVVAICGRNEEALEDLAAWKPSRSRMTLRPMGYCDHMETLLRAASLVVSRPGTGTTSEAIVCGCPIAFNGIGGIMPQERITVSFARQRGFGAVARSASDLSRIVRAFLENPERLARERASMASANPGGHPLNVLRAVASAAKCS